jgi:RNA polymerase sigma factor (sigma-70 family)
MIPDGELLQRYVNTGSEEAFTELVSRHFKVIYQAAFRQVGGDAHKAEDVAQIVFSELARQAAVLCGRPVLLSWLYTSTHFTAAKIRRGDQRRERREHEDYQVKNALPEPTPRRGAAELAAVLDAAMQGLGQKDKEAVLLRFFQGCSFKEVGVLLRVSEEAARKRVRRALNRLERELDRRGITSTTIALSATLSGEAGQPIPVGLSASVARAALAMSAAKIAPITTGVALAAFMSVKSIVAAALIVAVSAGIYYHLSEVRELHSVIAALEQTNHRIEVQLAQERKASVENVKRAGEKGAATTAVAPDPTIESALESWFSKIDKLTAFLKRHPEWRIPQMDSLTANEWLDVTKDHSLDSDADFRQALGELRQKARIKYFPEIEKALSAALAANGGHVPNDIQALAPFLPPGFNLDILLQLRLNPSGEVPGLVIEGSHSQAYVTDVPVDLWDGAVFYGPGGGERSASAEGQWAIEKAIAEYTKSTGSPPTSSVQLKAYPGIEKLDQTALEEIFKALTTRPTL